MRRSRSAVCSYDSPRPQCYVRRTRLAGGRTRDAETAMARASTERYSAAFDRSAFWVAFGLLGATTLILRAPLGNLICCVQFPFPSRRLHILFEPAQHARQSPVKRDWKPCEALRVGFEPVGDRAVI